MELNKLTTVMFAALFALGIAGCDGGQTGGEQPGGTAERAPTPPAGGDATSPEQQPGGEQPGGMGGGAGQP